MSNIVINRPLVLNSNISANGAIAFKDISGASIGATTVTAAEVKADAIGAAAASALAISAPTVTIGGDKVVVDVSGSTITFGNVLRIQM